MTEDQSAPKTQLQLQVEQALTMKGGNKDYISRLMHLAQISGSMEPAFDPSEEGDFYLNSASLTLNGVAYTSGSVQDRSKRRAKQMAANTLLKIIFNAVSTLESE